MTEDGQSAEFVDLLEAVAIGIGIGIIYFIFYSIITSVWGDIAKSADITIDGIQFHYDFGTIIDIHVAIVMTGFFILCCFIMGSYYYFKRGYKPKVAATLCCLNVVVISMFNIPVVLAYKYLLLDSFKTLSFMPIYFYRVDTSILSNFAFGFFAFSFFAIITILLYTILAKFSVDIFLILISGKRAKFHKKIIIFATGALLISIVIPMLVVYSGIETGWVSHHPDIIKKYPDMKYIVWPLEVKRTANDTIFITNNGYHTASGIDLGDYLYKDEPFVIEIQENDSSGYGYYWPIFASNSVETFMGELHNRQNLTIYPETGLGCEPGQTVTLTGSTVSVDNFTEIRITPFFYDGSWGQSTEWKG